jgi:hypothetical protein
MSEFWSYLVATLEEERDHVRSTGDDADGALVVAATLLHRVHQLGPDPLALVVWAQCYKTFSVCNLRIFVNS